MALRARRRDAARGRRLLDPNTTDAQIRRVTINGVVTPLRVTVARFVSGSTVTVDPSCSLLVHCAANSLEPGNTSTISSTMHVIVLIPIALPDNHLQLIIEASGAIIRGPYCTFARE